MKNNYAYIDGQNLHFGVKSLGWKLDHKKFRHYLEEEHGVSRAYIFLGYMEEHQDLYNVLQEAGFICHFKPLVRYEDGNIKGNVDADMVLQVMIDIDRYDKAVIVSGDGDFSGLVRHLIQENKLGQVIIPNMDKYSSLYDRIEEFDTKIVTYMNNLKTKLSYLDPKKKKFSSKPSNNVDKSNRPKPSKVPATKTSSASNTTKTGNQNRFSQTKNNRFSQPKKYNTKPQKNGKKPNVRGSSDFKPKSELEQSLLDAIDNV